MDAADRWWLSLSDSTRAGYHRWLGKTNRTAGRTGHRPGKPPKPHRQPAHPEVPGQEPLFDPASPEKDTPTDE